MLKLLKGSWLLLVLTGLLAANAQELSTKETPAMKEPKTSQGQPMLAQTEPDGRVLQAVPIDPTKDSIAQTEAHKFEAIKQRLDVAQNVQKIVTTQDTLEGAIASLATQMMQNKKMHTSKAVLITSFVRLDNFKKTSEFGRVVSESLINELSNRGFNLVEFRGQAGVSINAQGEYYITRDANKLNNTVENTYVVVGTYSRQYKNVMLNARVIDNITGKIISTARATYAHGLRDDCVIFKDCKPPRTIRIYKE